MQQYMSDSVCVRKVDLPKCVQEQLSGCWKADGRTEGQRLQNGVIQSVK